MEQELESLNTYIQLSRTLQHVTKLSSFFFLIRRGEHENVGSCEQVLLNLLNKQFA
jgi:hypothetical protein